MDSIQFHDVYFNFTAGGAAAVVGLMFAVGAAFGSFFNVVAYRLPRGMSLNRPGSRCPACGKPIRWYDNVPIFGWLMLGGRCRDCKAAISPRYPVMELSVAVATAIVGYTAIDRAPFHEVGSGLYTLDVAGLCFHLALVYTLVCAALIDLEGHRPPLRWLAAVLIGGAILTIFFPTLRSEPYESLAEELVELLRVLAGALLLGLLAWPILLGKPDRAGIRQAAARVMELAAVAAFLGLVPATGIAALAATLRVTTRFPWAAGLVIGTLSWFIIGKTLAVHWLADAGSQTLMFLAVGVIVAAMSIVERIARRTLGLGAPGERD